VVRAFPKIRERLDRPEIWGSLWIALAAAPIVLASGISYRVVLPLRVSLAGFPVSVLDAVIVLLFAAALTTMPIQYRKTTSILLIVAVVVAAIALAVGIVRGNSMYFVLRDARAALYFIVGVYLAGVISRTPAMAHAGLRLLALSAVVAACFQWARFVSGLSYGREAEFAGSGLLRDATIYQYTYAFAFGIIAATYGTPRRLFSDRISIALLCLIAATVSISLTRSAWLALAFAVCGALLLPRGRPWRGRAVVIGSLMSAAVPWIVLGIAGSPLATLPISRVSVVGDLESVFADPTTAPTPSVVVQPPPSPLSSPQTSSGAVLASPSPSGIAAPTTTPGLSPPPTSAPLATAPPTLTGRFELASTALSQLLEGASQQGGWTVWLFGFGFGHHLESFVFASGETAVGVTDIENAPIHFLWKTGLIGLVLVTAAVSCQVLTSVRRALRDQDAIAAGWLTAIASVLAMITLTGVGGAPYTMAIGGWLGFKASDESR
jgi:hypothetical protein